MSWLADRRKVPRLVTLERYSVVDVSMQLTWKVFDREGVFCFSFFLGPFGSQKDMYFDTVVSVT